MDYKKLYEELCYENEDINNRWAEDNERNNEIIGDQQEQIINLKERQLPFGWTIESIKNLQEDRDELKEENTEQSCEIIKLEGENKDLNSRWAKKRDEDGDSYRRLIMEVKEDYRKILIMKDEEIQTYKETLDEHFHHYDRLKEKNKKLEDEIDALKFKFAPETLDDEWVACSSSDDD